MDSIFIVVAFFIAVSLLSIPCMMYYKKKEKKEQQLISEKQKSGRAADLRGSHPD